MLAGLVLFLAAFSSIQTIQAWQAVERASALHTAGKYSQAATTLNETSLLLVLPNVRHALQVAQDKNNRRLAQASVRQPVAPQPPSAAQTTAPEAESRGGKP